MNTTIPYRVDIEQPLEAEVMEPPNEPATERGGAAEGPSAAEPSVLDLLELLLKDQHRLDRLLAQAHVQREVLPRLLAIAMIGYTVFGACLALVFRMLGVWPQLQAIPHWLQTFDQPLIRFAQDTASGWSRLADGSAPALAAAFSCGLIGSIGVCLPSCYFYGLLAGVRTTMLQVTTHALKGLASGAVALVGLLPVYFALALGLAAFAAPEPVVTTACWIGLVLPWLAGLWGTRSLYIGFVTLCDTMPPERRERRECFLRRLLLAWSVCFTTVTPVMVFTLWHWMA